MIEILKTKPLTLVQDLGRLEARQYGVGTAGAMDPVALQAGNLMLGNEAVAAGIEISLFPFHVRFLADGPFALTGADCRATLDGEPVPPWWTRSARAGQELRLQAPRDALRSRAYVCLAGGVDVPLVLGSRSTQLRGSIGGHEGRMLRAGDRIGRRTGPTPPEAGLEFGIAAPEMGTGADGQGAEAAAERVIRVMPASEFELFAPASIHAFWQAAWSITAQSNRAGYRLDGPVLHFEKYVEMHSYPVIPGLIQVPPGGQPIVQMMDANVSGGYPKLGVVIGADLWKLGQAGLGSKVRFVPCTQAQAVASRQMLGRYLNRVAACRDLARAAGSAFQSIAPTHGNTPC